MKAKSFMTIFVLLIILSMIAPTSSQLLYPDQEVDTELTIYTYESLLADPGYEFDRAFEVHAGLPNNSVEVVLLNDAGSIVTKAVSEKADPVADVLIGIDNVLVHQAREQDILEPYQPADTDNIIEGLVDKLAPDFLLTPYDFGVISLWYLNEQFETDVDLDTLALDDLLRQEIRDQLIVENPQLSSPGLGFLLSTIAMYGDEDVEGLIDGDWQQFWRELSVDTSLTSSWGDAISLLYSEEANRSIMVSYTTSPAYGACLWDDYSTTALLPTIDGESYGWEQIEGLGLVKNAQNPDLAKQFIDWFISEELQSQIHQNQWVYPAHEGIDAPDCYDAAIDPTTINSLNEQIPDDTLSQNLDQWLDSWEIAWAEGPSGGVFVPFEGTIVVISILIIAMVRRRIG